MKNLQTKTHDYWASLYQEQQELGLSPREFSKLHGIKADTFRQAVRRYNLKATNLPAKPSRFIELTGENNSKSCIIEIEYNKYQLRIFSEEHIQLLTDTIKLLSREEN